MQRIRQTRFLSENLERQTQTQLRILRNWFKVRIKDVIATNYRVETQEVNNIV